MGKTVNKIYHAAIYVRLSKEDGDVASAAKASSKLTPLFAKRIFTIVFPTFTR